MSSGKEHRRIPPLFYTRLSLSAQAIAAVYVLLLGSVLVVDHTHAQSQHVETVWQRIEYGSYVGSSNLIVRDLEGDGKEEIIMGAGGPENVFFTVLEFGESQYSPRWTSKRFEGNPIRWIGVVNLDGDADYEIYIFLRDGQVEKYDGTTLALADTFQTEAEEASVVRFADVDGNGQTEAVFLGADYLQIYEAATFTMTWDTTAFFNSRDVQVGDVDDDGEQEIVLSEGIVLDGATGRVKSRGANAFGEKLGLANITGNEALEIIGMSSWNLITAFDGAALSELWQINTGRDQEVLEVLDIEGDGTLEILMGNGQWGAINCYSAATQELLWQIDNPEHGVTNIAVGDTDHDGETEVVWGAGHTSSSPDFLLVGNIEYEQVEWQSQALHGPHAITVANMDDDSSLELVSASRDTRSETGLLFVHDGLSSEPTGSSSPLPAVVTTMLAGDVDGDTESEIVAAGGNRIYLLHGSTHQVIAQQSSPGEILTLALGDIDEDDTLEVVFGDAQGYVTIIDGARFEQEWRSPDLAGGVGGIELMNVDEDTQMEVILYHKERPAGTANSIVRIYDGKQYVLQKESAPLFDATALAVADLERDRRKEIVLGQSSGEVMLIDSQTLEVIDSFSAFNVAVSSLAIENLDQSAEPELVVGAHTLRVFSSTDFSQLWEADVMGSQIGASNNLYVGDLGQDGHMDFVGASSSGQFHLSATEPYLDITPPRIVSVTPTNGSARVGLDARIYVQFDEPMAAESVNTANIRVTASGDLSMDVSVHYDEINRRAALLTNGLYPANEEITVTMTSKVTDRTGNALDGNGNGYIDAEPDDDVVWSFITGEDIDAIGPRVERIDAAMDSVWAGIDLRFEVQLSDSGSASASSLAYVEGFIDSVGTFGTGIPFEPLDHAFDGTVETVARALETNALSAGPHTLHIHGLDANGNWGDFAEREFFVLKESPSSWPMHGQNALHTGLNDQDSIRMPLRMKWQRTITTTPLNPVAVVNGRVIASNIADDGEGIVAVLESQSGKVLWRHSFGNVYAVNPPSFGYGYVFVQSNNNTPGSFVTALDVASGEIVWQSPYDAQWNRHFAPTLSDGRLFVNGGFTGGMYAYDALSGRELWFKAYRQYDDWTPAVYEDKVYAYVAGTLQASEARTGRTIWKMDDVEFGGDGFSMGTAPVIDSEEDVIYVSSEEYVHAIDLRTRRIRWKQQGTYAATPAIFDGGVFTIESNALVVYDAGSGAPLWRFNGDAPLRYAPVISNGFVFTATDSMTYAVDIATRQAVWDAGIGGHLTVANNHLYVADESGVVYAFADNGTGTFAEDNARPQLPEHVTLHQNYPNPFRTSTTISYHLPVPRRVTIELYTLTGRLVRTISEGIQQVGNHSVTWQRGDLGSGVYMYRLRAGQHTVSKFLVVVN